MKKEVLKQDVFLDPGYVYMAARTTQLCTVVASGGCITLYDKERKLGGMGHYVYPYRKDGVSTARFAAPAIVALTDMFFDTGSSKEDLETHFYGGAVKTDFPGYTEGQSEDNVKVGIEILGKIGVEIDGMDVGGTRARKIVFNTGTGELMVAKVEEVRDSDWYPV